MDKKETVREIIRLLDKQYPMADCTLDHQQAYELLVGVRLAAQCTDKRVNMVTPALFAAYPDAAAMAKAEPEDIEPYIRSTGFFHGKARDIVGAARIVVEKFGGVVPDNMDDLLTLPGVGRKSANLILGDVYNVPGAVVGDTHCIRLTNRIGLVDTKDPKKIEFALGEILPPERSNDFCHMMVYHGRAVCDARRPACGRCVIRHLCGYGEQSAEKDA
jgi:endonuclease-3